MNQPTVAGQAHNATSLYRKSNFCYAQGQVTEAKLLEFIEIRLLERLKKDLEKIMADTSKLTAAVEKLSTDVDTLVSKIGPNPQPAIDAATTAVEAADAKVTGATPA